MTERFIDIKVRTGNSEATVKSLDSEVKKLSTDTDKVTKSTDKLATSMVKTNKATTQLTKTAKGVKTGVAGIGRASGQAGIQVQQFIGQIQGGQNAMLALSAQSADLGFVLGAPLVGAIVGIGASLVGILAPSFFKTSEAAKDFAFNVAEAAGEIENLQDLSRSQVSVAITDTSKSMDELSKEAKSAGIEVQALSQQLDKGERTITTFSKSGRVTISTVKLTKKETKELGEEWAAASARLDQINQEYKKESDLLVKLSASKDGYSKKTNEQALKTKDLVTSLDAQIIALRDGEEAAFKYGIAQQLGLDSIDKIPAAINNQIDAIFRLRNAKKQEAQQSKGSGFAGRLSQETDQLKVELALRQQVELGYLSQRDADLTARFVATQTKKDAAFQSELVKLGDDEIAKNELIALQREQQLLSAQTFEASLTGVHQKASDDRASIEENYSKQVDAMRMGVVSNAVGLLRQLVGDSKAGAIALIAVQKGLAIGETLINSQVAATRALAELGPVFGPPAAAKMISYGKISAGIIAATGVAEAAGSGGGGSSFSASSTSTGAATSPSVTQNFQATTTTESTALTELTNELRNTDSQVLPIGFVRDLVSAITEAQSSGQA